MKVVCELCGLVADCDEPPMCGHPGWPYGPGFTPPRDVHHLVYVRMRRDHRRPMVPYDGDVAAGLTDPAFHRLMAARP